MSLNKRWATLKKRYLMEQDSADGSGSVDSEDSNNPDAVDAFDRFLMSIVDALRAEYDVSEDDALIFVLDVAVNLVSDGQLPSLPEEGDAAEKFTFWLGKAKTLGFEDAVLKAAAEG